jgi:hypothetical protein
MPSSLLYKKKVYYFHKVNMLIKKQAEFWFATSPLKCLSNFRSHWVGDEVMEVQINVCGGNPLNLPAFQLLFLSQGSSTSVTSLQQKHS